MLGKSRIIVIHKDLLLLTGCAGSPLSPHPRASCRFASKESAESAAQHGVMIWQSPLHYILFAIVSSTKIFALNIFVILDTDRISSGVIHARNFHLIVLLIIYVCNFKISQLQLKSTKLSSDPCGWETGALAR